MKWHHVPGALRLCTHCDLCYNRGGWDFAIQSLQFQNVFNWNPFSRQLRSSKLGNGAGSTVLAVPGAWTALQWKWKNTVSDLTPFFLSHSILNPSEDSVGSSIKIDPNSGDFSHFLSGTPLTQATRGTNAQNWTTTFAWAEGWVPPQSGTPGASPQSGTLHPPSSLTSTPTAASWLAPRETHHWLFILCAYWNGNISVILGEVKYSTKIKFTYFFLTIFFFFFTTDTRKC